MNTPNVSIVIPTFNRAELLQQTLASLHQQTFENWEAIVVDDGSNEETAQVMLQISQQDPRIKYVKRSRFNSGAPACRNEGTDLAQGKYVIFLDSDDYLAPTALENRIQKMEQNPELDFGVFPCVLFREQPGDIQLLWNTRKDENDLDRFLCFDPPWQTTSPIWKRESLTELGGWNEALPSWQDFEFHVRALVQNLKYQWFLEPDCFWRVPHHGSIGDKSRQPKHLKSHEKLFLDVQQMLLQAGLLTNQRKHLLIGLYFWLMDAWASQAVKTEATHVWSLCRQRGLINHWSYLQGILYIEASSIWVPHLLVRKGLRRLTRECLKLTSPQGVIPNWSKTFRNAPLAQPSLIESNSYS